MQVAGLHCSIKNDKLFSWNLTEQHEGIKLLSLALINQIYSLDFFLNLISKLGKKDWHQLNVVTDNKV